MIFDTHCHLNLEDFTPDREAVFQRAIDAGVGHFLNVGIDLEKSREAVALAERFGNVYATVGLHPHDASQFSEEVFEAFRQLARHKKVVAIGEVGLDYFRNHSPQDVQKKVFSRFVALAQELNLPLVIHCREAYSDVFSILRESGSVHRGLMHCFSGNAEHLKEALALGFHISIAGPVTYKKNDELRSLAALVPRDRIVVETDAPFLPPEPYRGKRNEPAWIVQTVKRIAAVRGEDYEAMAETMTQNAKQLFRV